MYFGAYLLPLVNTNPKRDYGGVVNFAFERTALEFSFLKINRNKETIFDLWIAEVENADQGDVSRWDGFYAHFQPKFYNSEQSFKGFILGYAQKNFDTQTANITEHATGPYSTANFKPAVKQYLLMYNAGITHLVPGYGVELYYGLGVAYSRFDAGTSIDRDAYTIDNPLLESRKPGYFSPVFRAGVTMGINLGKGRD